MDIRMLTAIVTTAVLSLSAHGQTVLPNDFEQSGSTGFGPLFSYFGGVQGFGASPSGTLVYSGGSLRCWGNFRHDNIFRSAGFAVGTLGIDRASGRLGVTAGGTVFSIAVKAPEPAAPESYTSGQLILKIVLREDDNGDGIIDPAESDDAWESPDVPIMAGTRIYNIPLQSFTDSDVDVGNNIQNFGTTGRMACLITFETATTYPGGIIESPRELWIDHAGIYAEDQVLPTPSCPGDFDNGGTVTLQDLFDYLTAWFAGNATADVNGGGVTLQDLFDFLNAWFTPCP